MTIWSPETIRSFSLNGTRICVHEGGMVELNRPISGSKLASSPIERQFEFGHFFEVPHQRMTQRRFVAYLHQTRCGGKILHEPL